MQHGFQLAGLAGKIEITPATGKHQREVAHHRGKKVLVISPEMRQLAMQALCARATTQHGDQGQQQPDRPFDTPPGQCKSRTQQGVKPQLHFQRPHHRVDIAAAQHVLKGNADMADDIAPGDVEVVIRQPGGNPQRHERHRQPGPVGGINTEYPRHGKAQPAHAGKRQRNQQAGNQQKQPHPHRAQIEGQHKGCPGIAFQRVHIEDVADTLAVLPEGLGEMKQDHTQDGHATQAIGKIKTDMLLAATHPALTCLPASHYAGHEG